MSNHTNTHQIQSFFKTTQTHQNNINIPQECFCGFHPTKDVWEVRCAYHLIHLDR